MRKAGCVEPVIYFVCYDPSRTNPPRPKGWILLAPYTHCPTPSGYVQESVDTLHAIDKLEATLQRQELEDAEREMVRDMALVAARKQEVRDRLYARMCSSSTDEKEKDMIRAWLQLRSDHPRKKYHTEQINCYLWARHNDIGNRRADSEEFNVEKHEVKT